MSLTPSLGFVNECDLPYTALLESEWRAVRSELEQLAASQFTPWPETTLYTSGWDVFGLLAFGQCVPANCALCPVTLQLLRRIEALTSLKISTAGFSCLAPGVVITPHTGYHGYSDRIFRVHLALIVPSDGDCALHVAGVTKAWQEGRVLAFDDTSMHEAWNRGSTSRVVLLLDVEREPGSLSDVAPSFTAELADLLQSTSVNATDE
jgi:ornithine lipid ester-linked acyl 2-hydroxylase